MDLAKKKAQLLQAEPTLIHAQASKSSNNKFVGGGAGGGKSNKNGLTAGSHQYESRHNARQLNKQSTPVLNSYNNSVERFNASNGLSMQSMSINRVEGSSSRPSGGASNNKERRTQSVLNA